MPWIDKNQCTGCGVCVEACPVNTIHMENGTAQINMENCIHCGICHEVCPLGVVRHDSEKIPDEVEANVARTKEHMAACARYLGEEEKQNCLHRMIKHFTKERMVAEKTLKKLQNLKRTEQS